MCLYVLVKCWLYLSIVYVRCRAQPTLHHVLSWEWVGCMSMWEAIGESWQSHLKRISPFLVCGKDVWWCTDEEGYVFKDGNSDPEYQPAGPNLFHFRDTYLPQVYARQKECWETIIQNKIEIPATSIKVYSQEGDYTSTQEFLHHIGTPLTEPCQDNCSDHTISNESSGLTLCIENMQQSTPDNLLQS